MKGLLQAKSLKSKKNDFFYHKEVVKAYLKSLKKVSRYLTDHELATLAVIHKKKIVLYNAQFNKPIKLTFNEQFSDTACVLLEGLHYEKASFIPHS